LRNGPETDRADVKEGRIFAFHSPYKRLLIEVSSPQPNPQKMMSCTAGA